MEARDTNLEEYFNEHPIVRTHPETYKKITLTDNEKRDIYSTFDTEDQIDQGLPIDPFDLMNRLKQAGAMNEATTPSDALDEALNAFDHSEDEIVPNE